MIENNDKWLHKSVINWYPGHMVKAQNEIKASLNLIDIVIEVLDARIPISSSNPLLNELAANKAKIVILNKSDLADVDELKKWIGYFKEKNINCILTNANDNSSRKKILDEINVVGKKLYQNKDSIKKQIYRVLIVGIPNVGKSTIINRLSGKSSVNVGNKPGVTKKKQWIRLKENVDLLDTPGILWPKIDNDDTGIKLAITGNIKLEVLDVEEVAIEGIKLILKYEKYKNMLKEKYKINESIDDFKPYEILELIGKKRGCLISGGDIDYTKASNILLDDIKNGKIGKMSFDML